MGTIMICGIKLGIKLKIVSLLVNFCVDYRFGEYLYYPPYLAKK